MCFIKHYYFLFFQVSPCLSRFLFPLCNELKNTSKIVHAKLLQFHLCSRSFIMIRVTSYKKHANSCKEHGRHKYHTNSKKMHAVEWPSRESQSCLLDMQIACGHTTTLITKFGAIEQIWGKTLELFSLVCFICKQWEYKVLLLPLSSTH